LVDRYRLDLAAEFRSRRWRRLLNLIDGLPRHSHYVDALADDEQLAEQMLDHPPTDEPVERWTEFSPERETLLIIADRVAELTRVMVAANSGKPGSFRPLPRPHWAVDRLRTRRRMDQHRRLVAMLLPHKAD
jgi:hypothetical protein